MGTVELKHVTKRYGNVQAITDLSLTIEDGSFTALLGPSGCGKSTLLRMLTGLSPSSAGGVFWHGQPVRDESPNVSIVFQSFALFPWLTVLENVEAPLEARGMAPIERHKRHAFCQRLLWGMLTVEIAANARRPVRLCPPSLRSQLSHPGNVVLSC